MINESAQPIYIYPDQLLKETWPDWVELVLSKQPSAEHSHARGFQELTGSEDSTGRTRAGESYRLGLLLQRVIRERAEGAATPKGWQYLSEGKAVISKTGYLSYAIGKALSNKDETVKTSDALNVLYLLFALSLGIQYNSGCVSTVLVYFWTLQEFRKSIGTQAFDENYEHYSRFLAAAVFKTLDTEKNKSLLIDEYLRAASPTSLIIQKSSDNTIHEVSPILLRAKIEGKNSNLPNVNDIPSAKAPLFWSSIDRGIYQKAILVGNNLIKALIPLDQSNLKNHGTSILTPAIQVVESEDHKLLENLDDIFKEIKNITPLWRDLMEKLADGVYSALAYVEKSANRETIPLKFYLHGISETPDDENSLEVVLERASIPIEPTIGSSVIIKDKDFKIKGIEFSDTHITLNLEAEKNQTPQDPLQ